MAPTQDRVGQQLGNYELTRLIGKGGYAEVYLAKHVFLETEAAVKVLKSRDLRDDERDFFRSGGPSGGKTQTMSSHYQSPGIWH